MRLRFSLEICLQKPWFSLEKIFIENLPVETAFSRLDELTVPLFYGGKSVQFNFVCAHGRNTFAVRVWLNDAAAEKMELMVLSFLIADYDILREDRKASQATFTLARNLNAASARRVRLARSFSL